MEKFFITRRKPHFSAQIKFSAFLFIQLPYDIEIVKIPQFSDAKSHGTNDLAQSRKIDPYHPASLTFSRESVKLPIFCKTSEIPLLVFPLYHTCSNWSITTLFGNLKVYDRPGRALKDRFVLKFNMYVLLFVLVPLKWGLQTG